jgi:long-chain fatty acid transport protein
MRYFFVSALLGFSLGIQSQGFQVNLQGQKQQGMASAGTALIQDASALFFNPGGVSKL